MTERWLNVSPEAEKKRRERFERWRSGRGISFERVEKEAGYRKRATLIQDAIEMQKVPERIPVCPSPGHFPIEYSGISWYEAMYDYEKLGRAWRKFCDDFVIDAIASPRLIVSGKMLEILGFELYKWAGHGVSEDREFQFVEKEYMKAEEYQDLIDDPTGFFWSVYFPRICRELRGLGRMPLSPPAHEIVAMPSALLPFGSEDMKAAVGALVAAGEEANKWLAVVGRITAEIMAKGFPTLSTGFSKAPFDVIADSLRGTRGVIMDMFRRPDELREACERLVPFMVKCAVGACEGAGHLIPLIPLHKGADGFMSEEQYATFYWPTLRKVIIGLIDAGLVPLLFAEGSYNQRLDIISDLPKGTTIWLFDRTDMARAKETVGRVACIAGNVPVDLLCTGTPDSVRDYCRDLIEKAGRGGGFILSTGAGMQAAKVENVQAMVEYSLKYGVYS